MTPVRNTPPRHGRSSLRLHAAPRIRRNAPVFRDLSRLWARVKEYRFLITCGAIATGATIALFCQPPIPGVG